MSIKLFEFMQTNSLFKTNNVDDDILRVHTCVLFADSRAWNSQIMKIELLIWKSKNSVSFRKVILTVKDSHVDIKGRFSVINSEEFWPFEKHIQDDFYQSTIQYFHSSFGIIT